MEAGFDNERILKQLDKAQKDYEPKVYMGENDEIIVQYVPRWIKQIKIYCDFLNITPMQLVQQHMDLLSKKTFSPNVDLGKAFDKLKSDL